MILISLRFEQCCPYMNNSIFCSSLIGEVFGSERGLIGPHALDEVVA